MHSQEAQKRRSAEAGKGIGRAPLLKFRFCTSAPLLFCVSALVAACSSPAAYTAGNLIEPEGVAIAVPSRGDDPLPRTFAYVSDAAMNNVKVIDISLRVFEEAPAPYFPLEIPVGTRPTRLRVSPDQQRLYVLNAVSRDISVIDTGANAEAGAERWTGGAFSGLDPAAGGPRRLLTGLVMNDIATAFSRTARGDRLYVAADAGDQTGRLFIYDAAKYRADGTPNPLVFAEPGVVSLPGIPGRIDVSEDGDTVYLSNRTGKTVMIVDASSKTLNEIDVGSPTEFVRVVPASAGAGRLAFAGSKGARGLFVIDLDRMVPVTFALSTDITLGNMIPVSFGIPQDLAFAASTPLGTALAATVEGCPGTAGLVPLVSGGVAAIDVSGCALYAVANGNTFAGRDPALNLHGLFVEAEVTTPYVSVPAFAVDGRTLDQSEQAFTQYPRIEGWDRSERNYGVTISRFLRQFVDRSSAYVVYEGAVYTGTAGSFPDAQTFTEPGKDFAAARVAAGEDWLVIVGADGAPRTVCDDGKPIPASEFAITGVEKNTLTVQGPPPDATCIAAPFPWQIRPHEKWTVVVEGLGLLGRAAFGQEFLYPPQPAIPHFRLKMLDGTPAGQSTRDMVFSFQILFYPLSISAPDTALMPTDIAVAEDSINPLANWAFVVYSGSAALFQFTPRTLNSTLAVLYR